MNKHKCTVKGCPNYQKYCRQHLGFTVKEETPIAKESKKLAEARRQYAKKAADFKTKHPMCQAKITGVCTGKTQHVHHRAGRLTAEDLLNEKLFLAVCAPCHNVIEQNPHFARQNGFSVSRLAKRD